VWRAKEAAGNTRWGWEDIVTVCKDVHSGCALSPAPVAQPTVPAAPQQPRPSAQAIGIGADTHSKGWCLCDPSSKVYKLEVHEQRVPEVS
jgi:hypothetical protein